MFLTAGTLPKVALLLIAVVFLKPGWADVRADEFYQSCGADFAQVEVEKPTGMPEILDYSCLTTTLTDAELLVTLRLSNDHVPPPILDAHTLTFMELVTRPWAKNKKLLILSSNLSAVETARHCHRLKAAGFSSPTFLLGGPRAYLALSSKPEPPELAKITAQGIHGPLVRGRLRIVELSHYKNEQGEFDSAIAGHDIWSLQPSTDPEQYMSTLVVGNELDYRALQQKGLPYWAFLLTGGETSYRQFLAQREGTHKMRQTKLRKCALR